MSVIKKNRISHGSREEAANTKLADALRECGFAKATPESVGNIGGKHPDICFNRERDGARVVIEAEYQNRRGAEKDALNRLNQNPRPAILCAVSYPAAIARDYSLAGEVNQRIDYAFWSRDAWSWDEGAIGDFAAALQRAYVLSRDDAAIGLAIAEIQKAIDLLSDKFISQPGAAGKAAKILGITLPESEGAIEAARDNAIRMAGLIMISAFIFQAALAGKNDDVHSLTKILSSEGDLSVNVSTHWRFILKEINYVAVFKVAVELMESCAPKQDQVRTMIKTAMNVREVAGEGYDLMGRAYHYLLSDAKTLGAFYTSLPGATLLAGLSLANKRWTSVDWNSSESIGELKIADLACGTGTLLAAACQKARDNFQSAGGKETDELHKNLIEKTIWGYDILGSATHLTAATLGLMSPEVNFRRAHIYQAAIGRVKEGEGKKSKTVAAAGSLELLDGQKPRLNPFQAQQAQVETGEEAEDLGKADLCIMNPPYVRGTKGNEALSFLPQKEREAARARMKELAKAHGVDMSKGMGAAFVKAADKHLNVGGRLALILPTAMAVGSSEAWKGTRELINENYDLEFIAVSHDPKRPAFSENTALSEAIYVARKRKGIADRTDKFLFASLWRGLSSINEAQSAARAILEADDSGEDCGDLKRGEEKIGEFARLPYRKRAMWSCISFASARMSFAASRFAESGSLQGIIKRDGKIPLKLLGEQSQMFGGVTLSMYANQMKKVGVASTPTAFPAYWPGLHRHKTEERAGEIGTISEKPHCYLSPNPGHERWIAETYYGRAGRIILAQSFRFNTFRRVAVLLSEPVQCDHYWPITLNCETNEKAKAMVLWLNSTPALLLMTRDIQSTMGAKVMLGQRAAKTLPALDVGALSEAQLKKLAAAFDKAAKMKFKPIPQMESDPARILVDDTLSALFNLGDLSPLRSALSREPVICDKPFATES